MPAVQHKDDVTAEFLSIQRELLRRDTLESFKEFVHTFWYVLEPAVSLSWNWHLDVLCDIVQSSMRKRQNELINIPPGTMKSLLMSVFARGWLWAHDPGLRFFTASYGSHLSIRDNRRLRSLITSEQYRLLFPKVVLVDDQNVKVKFETTEGGWSIATSVGGVGTGEHPDYIIIDDPLTAQEAESEADRKSAISWLDRTISTRGVARGACTWLIMQRLHQQDPSQHALNKGGYRHTRFPMRYEAQSADARDQRTRDGELLWPGLFDENAVRKLEIELGEYGAAGQLQQRPSPLGGGKFKREWFKFVDHGPNQPRRRVRGWDIAASETEDADYTAGVRISEDYNGTFYIEHVVNERWSPSRVDKNIRSLAESDGKRTLVREEQEPGASGKTVIFSRAKMLVGWDYAGVTTSGSKYTRAQPFRAQCEAGNVCIVRAPWNEVYLDQLCNFPTASHDDMVDASSCAFNSLVEAPVSSGVPESVGHAASYWRVGAGSGESENGTEVVY